MEHFASFIGKFLIYVGGSALGLLVIGLLVTLMAEVWIWASGRWRGIMKAEKLIRDFRYYRDDFMEWLEERERKNGDDDV